MKANAYYQQASKLVQLNAVNADELKLRKDWHRSGRSERTGETTRET